MNGAEVLFMLKERGQSGGRTPSQTFGRVCVPLPDCTRFLFFPSEKKQEILLWVSKKCVTLPR